MNNKQNLVAEVIKELEKRAMQISETARATHEEAVCAPTPMESHSDKTRFEMQSAYAHQKAMSARYEAAIQALKGFLCPNIPASRVDVGSVVVVERDGKEVRYFILPEGNGVTLSVGDKMCAVITPGSPLGEVLMGKVAGEEFALGGTPPRFNAKVKVVE